jgi:hypothetical protein
MSAIDFDLKRDRLANPKGDRVQLTMSGKYLPYKYYGSEQGATPWKAVPSSPRPTKTLLRPHQIGHRSARADEKSIGCTQPSTMQLSAPTTYIVLMSRITRHLEAECRRLDYHAAVQRI